MKWFKHISDSLDDPFIFDLMSEHGPVGYLVFFGTLEIYAREHSGEDGWKLLVSMSYLRRKFGLSRSDLIRKSFLTISKAGKWNIKSVGDQYEIYIPKFLDLIDEYSRKKRKDPSNIRRVSGQSPDNVAQELEVDKEVDKEKEKLCSKHPTGSATDPSKKSQVPVPKEGFSDEEIAESSRTLTEEQLLALANELVKTEKFPKAHEFIQVQRNMHRNVKAVLHALNRCLLARPGRGGWNPWAYCETILSKENGNFNEREATSGRR